MAKGTGGTKLISYANPFVMQVAFISQEAREKAREIQVKADEEFAIEKVSSLQQQPCLMLKPLPAPQAKIVRQETSAIDAQFDKKRKQAEVSWKMYDQRSSRAVTLICLPLLP